MASLQISVTRGGLFSIPSRGSRGSGCSLIFGAERGALVVGKKLPGSIKKRPGPDIREKFVKNYKKLFNCGKLYRTWDCANFQKLFLHINN